MSTPIDSRALRSALGSFATGITVITARGPDGHLVGATVNSFASVSLDPPLVLWSLSLYSPSLATFQHCSHYAINILAHDQQALSQHFARPSADQADNKLSGIAHDPGLGGAPLLRDCCAWFECRNETRHAGGDHLIFVGLVERFQHQSRAPLLYHAGQYRWLADAR